MLRGIRKASSNWLGKTIMSVVMGVLILSFGVWGIADIFKGYGQSSLARVGGTEITTEQFRQLYTDKLQQIGRQFGRPLTSDQARAFGLDRQVLQQVIAETALDEDARRKGLGVSDAEVMKQITADPNFKGTNGAFDASRFQQLIRSLGYTEQRYIAEQRKVSLRRQVAGTVTAGIEPPKTMIEMLSRFQNEARTIDYVKLDAAQAGTVDAPSPEALAAYFEDHKAQFRAPEYRKIAFVVMTPEEMAKWSVVSDDDAKKAFELSKAKMSTPEQRQIAQISFPSAEEAQAARNKLSDTFSFDDLARERGLKPADIDLGMVTKAGIIDPSVADAAFSLAPDAISQPIKGQFGTVLVKVGKVQPGTEPSYDSVAAQVKRDLAVERARAAVADMHNKTASRSPASPSEPTSSRRPSPATSVSTTTRCRSAAAMSGSTCSGSRRRASGRWTRSRTRSPRAGTMTRSPAVCASRPPKWSRSSAPPASSPTKPVRPASPSRPRRRSSGTAPSPACPAASPRRHSAPPRTPPAWPPAPARQSGSCSASPASPIPPSTWRPMT
jgi:peptidyl-prolyl cis-trans isomerase D